MPHHIVCPLVEPKVKVLACNNVAIQCNFDAIKWQLIPVSMPERGNLIQVSVSDS